MGAVKRTHSNSRIDQQYQKTLKRYCQRNGLSTTDYKGIMNVLSPGFLEKMFVAVWNGMTEMFEAIKQAHLNVDEVAHD